MYQTDRNTCQRDTQVQNWKEWVNITKELEAFQDGKKKQLNKIKEEALKENKWLSDAKENTNKADGNDEDNPGREEGIQEETLMTSEKGSFTSRMIQTEYKMPGLTD